MFQIWLGTTYGAAIVLNAVSYLNTEASSDNPKPLVISVTGNVITLKGQILEIGFLDINGNLMAPINSNLNYATGKIDTNSGTKKQSNIDEDDDFNFNAQILSNSIADNFYGQPLTTTNNSNTSANSTNQDVSSTSGVGTATSSSPTITPNANSFVNPFSNSAPPSSADEIKLFTKPSKSKSISKLKLNKFKKIN